MLRCTFQRFNNFWKELQAQCKTEIIAEANFDPHKYREQPFIHSNVFRFNNYHLALDRLPLAIYITLFSWRGARLVELYHSKSLGVPGEERARTVDAIVKSWMETIVKSWMETFPDDSEQWVDLVVRALWYADPDRVVIEGENGESEYSGDSDGSGEESDNSDHDGNDDQVDGGGHEEEEIHTGETSEDVMVACGVERSG
ncbi:hypothetical protein CC86DRAFT_153197 [Ophiobolus disseminans]|uniref:Uncharacterized protein n=1 Tax=Ophiobolus disseminans TaxID=1469910 RepID=A0A6A6ZCA1_9PLEO|nr:hypothetical protein CC86DRAFT_153197 [Ophiobolus disseminans]